VFRAFETGQLLGASFSKSKDGGLPVYNHKCELPVVGTSQSVKILLKQLDTSDVFAAIQCRNGDIEIYGFDNGLESSDYSYNIQSGFGGSVVEMKSIEAEYQPPYLYYSAQNNETEDFDNLFAGLPEFTLGDFNNDFNNDFYNTTI